ncbi:MAG: recombinase [Eubacterium sp.]|nr:recombinase [Eubacterium sp.]
MQWHTPMGYSIKEGKIVIDEEKKKIVQQIFKDYDHGKSLIKIADNLRERGIKNTHGRVTWTHGVIGKILENHNYLGTEYYPQIIEKELFERVQSKREEKRKNLSCGKYRPSARERILFGGVLICGTCGQPYSHIQPKNRRQRHGVAKWKCKNYVYQNRLSCAGGFITDAQVMEVCVKAINQIINNKKLITAVNDNKEKISPRYRELNNQIENGNLETQGNIKTVLYERAAERYSTLEIKDEKQQTEEMLEILESRIELEIFDEVLYRKLIKQMIVYKDFTVKVVFCNGSSVTIEYGDKPKLRKGEENGS